MQHDIAKKTMESKKAPIKNLSDYDLTCDEINLLSRGPIACERRRISGCRLSPPTEPVTAPVTNESHIKLHKKSAPGGGLPYETDGDARRKF